MTTELARPEIEPKTPLGERLRDVRTRLNIEDRDALAAQLGISKGGLGNYERGERIPDATVLAAYRKHFGINTNWLLTGIGEMLEEDPGKDLALIDMIHLPQYDVHASAGRGLIAVNEMPAGETAFERSFLRNLGGAPDSCFLMWSAGDSMQPSIPDNALLIVDSSQTTVDHGRIYVFSVGNSVVVKRARWRMDGRLELFSDNASGNYPVETFDADRVEDLVVVGRVIFVGHPP